ncbi:MAG: DUF6152 family protein [Gammaproteobacteria bacterium]|nr:DUF6152 family protein [Gammaproteobacteria bacterium]MDH3507560.1 DUF6152 family protein [Gammaproteobacteria bacterium]
MRHTINLSAALMFAAPAWSHHSDAGLDMDSVVSLEGVVTEYSMRNPHTYFTVEAPNANGERVEWTIQMSSAISLARRGWTRDSLLVGDRISATVHAAVDGRPYGLLASIEKEGGIVLEASRDRATGEPEPIRITATESTDTLEGIWMADSSELVSYPGGFDGFFRAELRLTEQGAAAQAAYDSFSAENPEAQCIGRPTPAMIISSNLFPLQIEINEEQQVVVIRIAFWDEERTVYMDGRSHPDASERFHSGHSIGWWEGETLVVDTTNFTDHRSPYQIGVPSGAQKHVVERYRLIENGTRISAEFVLEDPEFIAEPLTHSRELIYTPQMEIASYDCDPEAARRFLLR